MNSGFLTQSQVGEVCIKGPNVTSGYLNNPKVKAGYEGL